MSAEVGSGEPDGSGWHPRDSDERDAPPEPLAHEPLSDERAIELLSYADVLEGDERSEAIAETASHENALRYKEVLQRTWAELGEEQVMGLVHRLQGEADEELARLGIEPSIFAQSVSWAVWDLAKQRYWSEHPDEAMEEYRENIADPFGSWEAAAHKWTEIIDRQVGWEVRHQGGPGAAPVLRSFQYAELGRQQREQLAEAGPTPERAETREELRESFAGRSEESRRHWVRGQPNEDAIINNPGKRRIGVFDGMGGAANGAEASAIARRVVEAHEGNDLSEAMYLANEAVNQELQDKGGGGTTGLVAEIGEWQDDGEGPYAVAELAGVGDSRAYVLRRDGTLEMVTLDDSGYRGSVGDEEARRRQERLSQVSTEAERDALSAEDQYYFRTRNRIGKAIGDGQPLITVSSRHQVKLGVDDTLFLTTDGIHDNLTNDEIKQIVADAGSAEKAVANLIAAAQLCARDEDNIRHKDDDMTAVAYKARMAAEPTPAPILKAPTESVAGSDVVAPTEPGPAVERPASSRDWVKWEQSLQRATARLHNIDPGGPKEAETLEKLVEYAVAQGLLDETMGADGQRELAPVDERALGLAQVLEARLRGIEHGVELAEVAKELARIQGGSEHPVERLGRLHELRRALVETLANAKSPREEANMPAGPEGVALLRAVDHSIQQMIRTLKDRRVEEDTQHRYNAEMAARKRIEEVLARMPRALPAASLEAYGPRSEEEAKAREAIFDPQTVKQGNPVAEPGADVLEGDVIRSPREDLQWMNGRLEQISDGRPATSAEAHQFVAEIRLLKAYAGPVFERARALNMSSKARLDERKIDTFMMRLEALEAVAVARLAELRVAEAAPSPKGKEMVLAPPPNPWEQVGVQPSPDQPPLVQSEQTVPQTAPVEDGGEAPAETGGAAPAAVSEIAAAAAAARSEVQEKEKPKNPGMTPERAAELYPVFHAMLDMSRFTSRAGKIAFLSSLLRLAHQHGFAVEDNNKNARVTFKPLRGVELSEKFFQEVNEVIAEIDRPNRSNRPERRSRPPRS